MPFTMDPVSEARLLDLAPQLAKQIRRLAELLHMEGIYIRLVQALRSWYQQDLLFAKGRTHKSDIPCHHKGEPQPRPVGTCGNHPLGAVVTNCPGGSSYHNFGMAGDVVPSSQPEGQPFTPDWNTSHPEWKRIIEIAQSLGLDTGATWRTFKDYPHVQLTGRFPEGAPDDEVRQLFKDGGMQAVWEEAQIT